MRQQCQYECAECCVSPAAMQSTLHTYPYVTFCTMRKNGHTPYGLYTIQCRWRLHTCLARNGGQPEVIRSCRSEPVWPMLKRFDPSMLFVRPTYSAPTLESLPEAQRPTKQLESLDHCQSRSSHALHSTASHALHSTASHTLHSTTSHTLHGTTSHALHGTASHALHYHSLTTLSLAAI